MARLSMMEMTVEMAYLNNLFHGQFQFQLLFTAPERREKRDKEMNKKSDKSLRKCVGKMV